MATIAEQNAGFDVAHEKITNWVNTLIPDHHIPFVGNMRQIAHEKLNSPEGRKFLLDEVRSVLEAAEAVRAKKP